MNLAREMPTIRFSEIVDSFADMHPSRRMKAFQETLMVYIRKKYPSEKNDRKRIKCFEIDYYEQIIKSPSDNEETQIIKIKNIGRSVRRWMPPEKNEAKDDKVDYMQRESVIATAFTLAAESVIKSAERVGDNGRDIAKKLLYAMGYPDLSASSEAEIFVIFALERGTSYRDCQKIYGKYLEFKKNKNIEPDLQETGTTTMLHNYFSLGDAAQGETQLFEKVAAKVHAFRAGSKKILDNFTDEFNRKAKDSSVLDTAALFYLMFSTEIETQKKAVIYSDVLDTYKAYIDRLDAMSSVDELSEWLWENKCCHFIIRGKKSKVKQKRTSEDGCLFDTFYSELDKCRSKKYEAYISREGYIMWQLFCGKKFEEINTAISCRFPMLNMNSCFDRYAAIIADFYYKDGRIVFYDRLNNMDYVVENDQEYDWVVPLQEDLCQLRASVANVLGYDFPAECRIPSLVATGMYVATPKMFQIRTQKSVGEHKKRTV